MIKIKKSVLIILLATLLLGACLAGFSSLSVANANEQKGIEKAKSAYLIDYNTGTVLYERNPDQKLPIASMVKIMTLVLAFESIENGTLSLNQKICVSETASGMGGSQMFLDANKEYSVSDLIKGIVVCSANDASVAIGETISGSTEEFIESMNKKAVALGMLNTVFTNVTGLPEAGHHSTARDVAKMMRELLKHKEYYNFSKIYMEDYKHPDGRITELTNTNKLVRFYKGCDAGKTGFTNEAMFCLSASAERAGMRVVATVVGSPDSKSRFAEVTSLFNHAFANYKNEKIIDANKPLENEITVLKGKHKTVEIRAENSIHLLQKKGEKLGVSVKINLPETIKAPVKKGDIVGEILVLNQKGETVAKTNVICLASVSEMKYGDGLERVLEKFFIK
ncbi:MAG: D-alanyl-D-alanine carboxypeptidase [Firmicutes bacterium]|nr:D-alanyl-D-alanine carboxypeptidase [Bacillota bacterium]